MSENMFCYQCEETAKGKGCSIIGVCGKTPEVAKLQDLLIYQTKKLSASLVIARQNNITIDEELNKLVVNNLFTTITNANFDEEAIKEMIDLTTQNIKKLNSIDCKIDFDKVGVLASEDEDIRSLKELITYGLKGLAAYVKHANVLGFNDEDINIFIQSTLSKLLQDNLNIDDLLSLVMETGEYGVKGMALLDKANTSTYGNPEISKVNIGVRNKPGILISGHDLKDLELLLEQSKDAGVDIYTHSEMLPAHYYPKFKKYKHFAGNYGNAWWKQQEEFESFNGPILMTTNCIVPVKDSYKDRLYTTGASGYPGCKHIGDDKDFSEIIKQAQNCEPPKEIETGEIIGGFAHEQVFALADKIIEAIKNKDIRKFVVMGGCDGRKSQRNYYTELAKKLPKDVVILTAGCAKYKYNKLDLGDINGIPRVLDAGQCNDSYSLALIALKLKEILELDDINDLPIIYNIAWYEQKAVIVLLALLSLGVKNIHLGPTLPAFISENVLNILVEKFNLQSISSVEEDLKLFL